VTKIINCKALYLIYNYDFTLKKSPG